MKITFITGYFYPEQSADTRLNLDLAYSMAGYGCDVTVITPFPTRGVSNEVQQEYLNKKREILLDNLQIIRIGVPAVYQQNIIIRGMVLLKKVYQMYVVAKSIDTDVYLITSTPPFLGYVAALLARTKPVVYKLQDIFPDSLKHSWKLTERNPLIYFFRRLEKCIYKVIPSIVVCSDDMKRTVVEHGAEVEKITTIYDWIDEEKCYPVSRDLNYLFDEFGLSRDDFYACYAGNIGLLQNVQTIVKAAKILMDKGIPIKFVIIGDGSWKKNLEKMLHNVSCDNVFLFPMQSVDKIAYVYSLGDVGLVSLKPDITKYALPSKTWDILSAGRAAICEIDLYSNLCGIIEEAECGYCVAPNDAIGLADRIEYFYNDRQKCERAGKNGRKYIKSNLTRSIATKKYYEIMSSLVSTFERQAKA